MQDLFEIYETLPQNVQDIILTFEDENTSYKECERLLKELNECGYTFEYGLDALPYDLRIINN